MLQYRDELAQRLSLPPPENGKTFPDPNNNNNATTNCLKPTMAVKPTTMVNNTTNNSVRAADKYSLRPRSIRSIRVNGCIDDDHRQTQTANSDQLVQKTQEQPNGVENGLTQTNGLTQLNGATNMAQLANGKSSRPPKPKQKPAPLSKYRRKTANARERSRMREINSAFEALRRAVPHIFVSQCPGAVSQAPSEKLTKITTLRLAMRYIAALSAALNNTQTINNNNVLQQNSTSSSPISSSSSTSSASSLSPSSLCSPQLPTSQEFALDLDTLLMESSDAESLCTLSDNSFPLSDQPLTPVTFDDNPLTDATNVYFGDQTLSLDFTTDHSLSPDFSSEHSLSPFDQFLPHFS